MPSAVSQRDRGNPRGHDDVVRALLGGSASSCQKAKSDSASADHRRARARRRVAG